MFFVEVVAYYLLGIFLGDLIVNGKVSNPFVVIMSRWPEFLFFFVIAVVINLALENVFK